MITGKTADGKHVIKVSIELEQLHNNAIPRFSVMGRKYKVLKTGECGKRCFGRVFHSDITDVFPTLSDVVDFRLASIEGVPMFAKEDGWYYIKNNKPMALMRHLRISKDETTRVMQLNEEEFYNYVDAQIPRWNREAKEVIKKYDIKIV